ncbi:N-acetylmuramoyl-L-alanine amidase, partial [Candidatus Sumerlaeota bacterium]|nr:N-acetylmuramoyl-L-alanine amidase [Candidatus Sumerlaeota bacterium]
GAPLALAREGACLAIDGRIGNALRIALSPSLHGWLARDLVDIKPAAPPLRRGTISNVSVTDSDTTTLVRIPLGLRVPFAVTDRVEPPSLELTLFGVNNRLDWVVERAERGFIETITTLPATDGSCRFYISVRAKRLFGFRTYYDGDTFWLVLRHPPKPSSDPSRPLAGRTIVVDPGHGGASNGTLGSTGIQEKVINLEMARVLRRLLEKRGATVRLTRSDDYDVSLAERAHQAELGGDLFVSVHNNSIALTSDPLRERGVSVYYYHSQSREAAEAIYHRMLNVEPRPHPWGLVRADLYVVREITAVPSVLVECLFLSHPEDEMLLMDKAYVERDMEAVAAGIADWFAAVTRR